MWVNYRKAQDFPIPLQYSLQMLAPFAALAIKSGVQSAQVERQRRERMQRDFHDSLAARLDNAARAMDRLSFCEPGTERWRETFQIAQISVKWATTVVSALLHKKDWMTLRSIVADLQAQADVSSRIYQVPVRLHATAMPATAIDHQGGNELLFACNEAINNALRHAHATHIDIQVELSGPDGHILCVTICDDGIGFEPAILKRINGIQNMRSRIEDSLAGSFAVESEPGKGTTITFAVPLCATIGQQEN
jgi:signal transduction histidine kinase